MGGTAVVGVASPWLQGAIGPSDGYHTHDTVTFQAVLREKAQNAKDAGAVGVIIFNEGNNAERQGPINGTLDPSMMSLPVIRTSLPWLARPTRAATSSGSTSTTRSTRRADR
jgi:PA domain